MNAGIAALLGASIAGLLALAGQAVNHKIAFRNNRRGELSARWATYLSSTYTLVLAIGTVARAPLGDKPRLEAELTWPRNDAVNRALSEIELRDDEELVAAAAALDKALRALIKAARVTQYDRQTWVEKRTEILGGSLPAAKAIARAAVRRADGLDH